MSESRETTTTLIRVTEESPSGIAPAETPVVGLSVRDPDPVVISMTEPRVVFVGLPPAPVEESVEATASKVLSVLRPRRRVEIEWDAQSGSYRLGLTD